MMIMGHVIERKHTTIVMYSKNERGSRFLRGRERIDLNSCLYASAISLARPHMMMHSVKQG
jgi:hypothetical protein